MNASAIDWDRRIIARRALIAEQRHALRVSLVTARPVRRMSSRPPAPLSLRRVGGITFLRVFRFNLSLRRVGGITFLRVFRFNLSWSVTKKTPR